MPLPANHSGITERQDFAPAFLRLFELSGTARLPRPDYHSPGYHTIYAPSVTVPFTAAPLQHLGLLRSLQLEVLAAQILNIGHLLNGRQSKLLGHSFGHCLCANLLTFGGLLLRGLDIIHLEDIEPR